MTYTLAVRHLGNLNEISDVNQLASTTDPVILAYAGTGRTSKGKDNTSKLKSLETIFPNRYVLVIGKSNEHNIRQPSRTDKSIREYYNLGVEKVIDLFVGTSVTADHRLYLRDNIEINKNGIDTLITILCPD